MTTNKHKLFPLCLHRSTPIFLGGFVFLFGLIGVLSPLTTRADGGSLSIFPQTGSFTAGSTFEVSIFMNTGGNNINAVQVDLKFDPKRLQVITPAKGISVVEEWIFPPSFSNIKGTINLQGGFLREGINTSEGLITVIVFEAISPGKMTVDFLDSSKVLVGGEGGVNILTSVNRGVYNILPPPFKGPRIFSETHPDQNKWYKNNSPTYSW
ncbi:MAG: cohesin domain-containing protein, partial [Candidatus Aminicenantia bacterium]